MGIKTRPKALGLFKKTVGHQEGVDMTVGRAITGTDNLFAHMRVDLQHLFAVEHFQLQSDGFLAFNRFTHGLQLFLRSAEAQISLADIFHIHIQFLVEMAIHLYAFQGQGHLFEVTGRLSHAAAIAAGSLAADIRFFNDDRL